MNNKKAPGSDEWISPTPVTKINLTAELTQKKICVLRCSWLGTLEGTPYNKARS